MKYYEQNKKQIVQYLSYGCKSKDIPLCYGVELEHFLVHQDSKEAVLYLGDKGVEAILTELAPLYEEKVYSEGHLIALGREGIALSLEPAAQLEVSISPQQNVIEIKQIYDKFLEEITPIIEKYSYHLITEGYQPKSKVSELPLLPKARYRFMDRYFEKIGPYGRQMMRGTAATQVSIDYYSEQDFGEKYKAAYRLKDVLSYMFHNAPHYEGEEYTGLSLRDEIWTKTDVRRVNVEPYLNEGTLSFEAYADFVLQTPVIVNRENGTEYYDERTIGEIAKERLFLPEEIPHMLSMVFPMIRAKQFLEIRFADSMPIADVLRYVIVLKGLFSDMEYTVSWLYSDEFDKLSITEQVEYLLKKIEAVLSAEDIEYIKGNQI